MDLATLLSALDTLASVSILLAVLWLLSKGKLRTEAEIESLKRTLENRIDEITADRDFYRDKYADGEAMRQDRDWYRDRLEKSTNILGTLLSTVEVEETGS